MPAPPRHLALAVTTLLACFLTIDACWIAVIGPHLSRPGLDAPLPMEFLQ
jgi:hypothetical protein